MKIKCFGGPFNGREFTVNKYLPVYDLPCPWEQIVAAETIETYRQYYRDTYQWVGSRPYYPPNLQVKDK